jgi:hypothetical protein
LFLFDNFQGEGPFCPQEQSGAEGQGLTLEEKESDAPLDHNPFNLKPFKTSHSVKCSA